MFYGGKGNEHVRPANQESNERASEGEFKL